MSGRLNRPKQTTVRKSVVFNDTIPPGQTDLETNSIGLESDENAIRSQLSRFLDVTGLTRWWSDVPTVNGKKRGLLQLNTGLDAIERISEAADSFVPTTNQTVFALTQTPIDPNKPFVELNGQDLKTGQGFSISGTILTIILPYQLNSDDDLVVKYNYLA